MKIYTSVSIIYVIDYCIIYNYYRIKILNLMLSKI